MRAFAVLSVMLLHGSLLHCGWVGVQMFFVLSGFLITHNLLADRGAPMRDYLERFYRNRALRIMPLYFAYLALLAAAVQAGALGAWPRAWPYLATFTYNLTRPWPDHDGSILFVHFWSLAVEEQFYLAWPLIVRALGPRRLPWLTIATFVAAALFRHRYGAWLAGGGRAAYDVGDAVYWNPFSHVDAFAAGAFVAAALVDGTPGARRVLNAMASRVGTIVGLTLLAGIANMLILGRAERGLALHSWISSLGYEVAETRNLAHVWSYSLLNFAAAGVVAWVVVPGGEAQRWLRLLLAARPLVAIGQVSYGMYVWHYAVIWLFSSTFPVAWTLPWRLPGFAAVALGTYLLALASYHGLERRFLRLKAPARSHRLPSAP